MYQQNKAINRLKIRQGLSEDISLVSLKVFPYKIQVLRVRDDLSRQEKITYSYNVGDHLESLEQKPIEYDNVLNFAL